MAFAGQVGMQTMRSTPLLLSAGFSLMIVAAVLVIPFIAPAADAPSREELDAITERGRALAAYDQAAWHSTDAVLALKPRGGAVTHYIPRRTPTGWVVAFG